MNAAIYRFAPYTGSLKIEQQTFCLVHSLFQFVWLSEDVYIITPSCHSVKYFFEGNFWEIVFKGFRGFRGEGIAIGAASRQGSEGSEGSARFQQAGSKGVVSPDGDEYICCLWQRKP